MSSVAATRAFDLLNKVNNAISFQFEKDFQYTHYVNFASNNWPLAIGLVIGYMVFITVGSKVMANTKAFDLRMSLAVWNAFLSIFSFIGMIKTVRCHIFYFFSYTYFFSLDALLVDFRNVYSL